MVRNIHNVINKIGGLLHRDKAPEDQPKGTHRFALNAINETPTGNQGSLTNEKSNYPAGIFPAGFHPIGDIYLSDNTSGVILINPETGGEQIGIVNKDNQYNLFVDTKVLGLKITNQCDIRYRVRRGNDRVIYWVDALNRARTFNFDRPQNFYTAAYQQYLKSGGNPNTYPVDKWDAASFDLIKSYKLIPHFSNVAVIETGNTLPGSYNFAVQYVDEDLNPTEWITTSNTVNIFNDTTTNAYHRIRGSKNIHTLAQNFPRASKSIKLTITNLDDSFPYYRVAIIRAAGLTGEPDEVLASDLYSTSDSNFVYTGNDSALAKINLADILIDGEVIYAPRHIEQIENRLILSHTKGKGINWCEFQKYASKISSDLVTKQILLNNIQSEPNPKNPKSTFIYRGYMPGEVYSFGIAYIFSDGYVSPVFTIPGKSTLNTTSKMKVYEGDSRYLDIHNCSVNNYWGLDSENNTLIGKKIRPHRFPFRKEVNKPLVTTSNTTNTINKHRLKIVITLNPAWTPGPIEYPKDVDGNPIPIPYVFNYHVTGSTSNDTLNGILVDTDLGQTIYVYDGIDTLDAAFSGAFGQLDPGSTLATYQSPGNDRFIISFTYETYTASTSFNDDVSEIFGIEFSAIEKPHPDVIGFYIVRNERTDDDKLILDNAILGPMTEFQDYKSFGLLTPKNFYAVNNCGLTATTTKTTNYYERGIWFFSPEHQFFGKKIDFDKLEVEGKYNETSVNMPTISNHSDSSCNNANSGSDGGTKGVYIEDVQAGTSYDPNINKKKDKDDDGFDLIIGYKNTNVSYQIDNVTVFPIKKNIIYLDASSYKTLDGNIYYNTSVDNKIGEYTTNTDIDTSLFNDGSNHNHLFYASLVKNNTNAYSNFITRPYYKEHNNPIYFGNNTVVNGVKIFNGDAQISAIDLVSSVFYNMVMAQRSKKNKVWKIVVGVVLVAASIAATIFTAGAASPTLVAAITSMTAIAISYGVSLATSGIKFEQMKQMVEDDYEKGLRETVFDGGVFETLRDFIGLADDTIRWFTDRVSNVYIETSVPMGLRVGLTGGIPDFVDSPSTYDEQGFRTYLTEKLTTLDREQGSGRLYRGFASAEFYDANLDYMRFNKQKLFSHLPVEYDCCSDPDEVFPLRVWNSEQSFQEEKVDNYRVFLPNNYRDIEGVHGEITGMYRLGNGLFILTREGLWQLPQNNQERITGEIVSFIGTGEFFSIPPRKVVDDNLGSAGTQHKWSIVKTGNGVLIVNEIEGKVYIHADRLQNISNNGNRNWFKDNLKPNVSKQLYTKFNVDFLHDNNPANSNGIGYLSAYDTRYERLLVTKRDYSLLPEKLLALHVVNHKLQNPDDQFAYCIEDGLFYEGQNQIGFNNDLYFENRSFTISYSFHVNGWVSMHSYLPNYYIYNQDNLYSFLYNDNHIWKHHDEQSFQTFFGVYHPHIIEYVSNDSPVNNEILNDITLFTEAKRFDPVTKEYINERFITFNKLEVYNQTGHTGELIMKVKDTQPTPNSWYQQQITNSSGVILITNKEGNWNINDFRDFIVNYDIPKFTTEWSKIKDRYYIDRVVNPSAIDHNKKWGELQNFRGKYVIVRLIFDNFNRVSLTTNYTLQDQQDSIR